MQKSQRKTRNLNLNLISTTPFVAVCFLSPSNLSISKASTYKGLTTLIVVVTCITEGHPSTCVNKTVIYHFTFYPSFVLSQLEFFPATLDPTQACHNRGDKPVLLPAPPPFLSIFHLINIHFHPN